MHNICVMYNSGKVDGFVCIMLQLMDTKLSNLHIFQMELIPIFDTYSMLLFAYANGFQHNHKSFVTTLM